MDRAVSLTKIQHLVAKYEDILKSGKIKTYNEEETKKDFLLPLFEALGWNVANKREVSAEEVQSGGRVDYGFYINDRAKFYLEAKSLSTDLSREEYANQAIRYSWNKGMTWAVLSDFENLKVFNAQDISKNLSDKLFFDIHYRDYISRFDQLYWLSKEAFETDLIDKKAERVGKKMLKVSVSSALYKDLNECRTILTNDLSQWNNKVDPELIDEGVQKILDRLIFLRVAEDRGLEPPTLKPLVREWENRTDKNKVPLYKSMVSKFREFDAIYNSNLFSEHPFEDWDDYSRATQRVIDILYGKEGYYDYDFKAMPADILGTVYENYLGYKLLKSKKKTTVSTDDKKRKDQGIYYTPDFVVDYIVKSALKPVLDRCQSINDVKKIRVLDPACGSGSFLIKAFQLIRDKYKDFGYQDNAFTNFTILLENIYGVDLDPQAVEIARLNLLISALDERMKLPILSNNIKNGNSLISGTEEELKKYFGKDYRDKNPFNWHQEFPEVFKQGGFDVIVGNPPYINAISMSKNFDQSTRTLLSDSYQSAKGAYDIYLLFVERGVSLLKDNGLLSFITPNKYLSASYAKAFREWVLENCQIEELVDISRINVFSQAATYPLIILLKKSKVKEYQVKTIHLKSDSVSDFENKNYNLINNESKYLNLLPDNIWGFLLSDKLQVLKKIFVKSHSLSASVRVTATSTASEADLYGKLITGEPKNGSLKVINTGTIDRYRSLWGIKEITNNGEKILNPYLPIDNGVVSENRRELYKKSKIIFAKIGLRPEAMIDINGEYASINTNCVFEPIRGLGLKFLLAYANSKLFHFIYSQMFGSLRMGGGYYQYQAPQLRIMPLIIPSNENTMIINKLADSILDVYKKMRIIHEKSDEWTKLYKETELLDKKIDEQIYKVYELGKDEIKIIESEFDSSPKS